VIRGPPPSSAAAYFAGIAAVWLLWLVRAFREIGLRHARLQNTTGMTNVWRNFPAGASVSALVLDVAKGALPALSRAALVGAL